jgi:TatD DNase family protein
MEIFDSHSHLYLPEFAADLSETVQRAREAGVTRIVSIGIDAETTKTCLKMAEEREGFYASAGWHPHDAKDITEKDYAELKELALRGEAVGVGEIGLDFYWDNSPRHVQLKVFENLLGIAEEVKKPVIIHSREAFGATLPVLTSHRGALAGILIHCFGGSWEEAKQYLDIGAFLSIPGTVTFKKANKLRAAVKAIPRDRMLIETDAPYLAPSPFRGRRNEPAYLAWHIKAIAGLWETEEEEVAAATFRNASAFFGLDHE